MAFRIRKLVAMITGGASGLGKATAQHFVKHGAKVSIIDLPDSAGEDVVEKLGTKNCTFCPCDVTNSEDVMDAIQITKGVHGALHVLVNCAGKALSKPIHNENKQEIHNLEYFQSLLDCNVVGTFNTIRLAVPEMAKNDPDKNGQRGVIINVSSTAAFDGETGQCAYATSCAAVNAMTLPLSRELCHKGIRVLTIAPGYFDTEMLENIPTMVREYIGALALCPHRLGNPAEFATMVRKVVENPMLNGEVIRLDGGLRPIY